MPPEYTAIGKTVREIAKLCRVSPDKVDVVHNGFGATRIDPAPEADVRARYELGDRAVALSVSAKRPHKNLVRLLEAMAQLPAEGRPVLVLPGYSTWHEEELRQRLQDLGVRIE